MSKNKSIKLEIRLWLNEKNGDIRIASKKNGLISTVSNRRKSKRYQPSLHKKLSKIIKRKR